MKKWEYEIVSMEYLTDPNLNVWGDDGWEIVHIEWDTNTRFYKVIFKREKDEKNNA